MREMTSICFSVISHGHGPLLHRLLSQMNAQPTLFGARVVVTLNLVTENFDPTPYALLDLHVVRNSQPKGFGANHNAAFGLCNSAWFAVLNPDLALIDQEPFTGMLTRLGSDDNDAEQPALIADLIAPRVVAADLVAEDSVRTNLTPWSLLKRAAGKRIPLQPHSQAQLGSPFFWVAGMCMMVRASAFRKIGGFDERFFLYCEDYFLCARFYNAGCVIRFDPLAQVIHEAQRDSHRSWRHLRWHLTSLIKVWASSAYWRVTLFAPRLR